MEGGVLDEDREEAFASVGEIFGAAKRRRGKSREMAPETNGGGGESGAAARSEEDCVWSMLLSLQDVVAPHSSSIRNENETYHCPQAYIPSCDSASSFLLRGWDLRGDGGSRGQKERQRRRSVDDDGVGGGFDRVERLLCLLDYIMNAWSDTTNRASDATAADDDHGKTDFFQSIWNMRGTTTTNTTAKSMKGAIPTPTPPKPTREKQSSYPSSPASKTGSGPPTHRRPERARRHLRQDGAQGGAPIPRMDHTSIRIPGSHECRTRRG